MTKYQVRSVEITEDHIDRVRLLKVTFFEDGTDVAMFRYGDLNTALNAIKQFYAGRNYNV